MRDEEALLHLADLVRLAHRRHERQVPPRRRGCSAAPSARARAAPRPGRRRRRRARVLAAEPAARQEGRAQRAHARPARRAACARGRRALPAAAAAETAAGVSLRQPATQRSSSSDASTHCVSARGGSTARVAVSFDTRLEASIQREWPFLLHSRCGQRFRGGEPSSGPSSPPAFSSRPLFTPRLTRGGPRVPAFVRNAPRHLLLHVADRWPRSARTAPSSARAADGPTSTSGPGGRRLRRGRRRARVAGHPRRCVRWRRTAGGDVGRGRGRALRELHGASRRQGARLGRGAHPAPRRRSSTCASACLSYLLAVDQAVRESVELVRAAEAELGALPVAHEVLGSCEHRLRDALTRHVRPPIGTSCASSLPTFARATARRRRAGFCCARSAWTSTASRSTSTSRPRPRRRCGCRPSSMLATRPRSSPRRHRRAAAAAAAAGAGGRRRGRRRRRRAVCGGGWQHGGGAQRVPREASPSSVRCCGREAARARGVAAAAEAARARGSRCRNSATPGSGSLPQQTRTHTPPATATAATATAA